MPSRNVVLPRFQRRRLVGGSKARAESLRLHLVGGESLPQCWYPMMSPLGLGLRSSPAEVSSSVVPAAEADLFDQCAHPPLLFPHKGTQSPNSAEDPGLGPPSSYTCDAGDELTRKYIYYEPTPDAIPRWDAICGETFWSKHAAKYDWSAVVSADAFSGCVGRLCRVTDSMPDDSVLEQCAKPGQDTSVCKFSVDR